MAERLLPVAATILVGCCRVLPFQHLVAVAFAENPTHPYTGALTLGRHSPTLAAISFTSSTMAGVCSAMNWPTCVLSITHIIDLQGGAKGDV
ncbi:MAG: hypothetical protein OXU75_06310, partial [Deltaproteobacteria bacterium]|nr:hypothetical protein [Deltaproteobacteria bacterium]